jgi:hypothetical protein
MLLRRTWRYATAGPAGIHQEGFGIMRIDLGAIPDRSGERSTRLIDAAEVGKYLPLHSRLSTNEDEKHECRRGYKLSCRFTYSFAKGTQYVPVERPHRAAIGGLHFGVVRYNAGIGFKRSGAL